MFSIFAFILVERKTDLFQGIDLFIFLLIVVVGIIAFVRALRSAKEEKEGFPPEDELSLKLKYKSGYYAYLASMYLWFFIFIFKDKFPNTESMLGAGILLSALILFISKLLVKKEIHGKQD